MTDYLIIATHDPVEGQGLGWAVEIAMALRAADRRVCLFLAENGALAARAAMRCVHRDRLTVAGVEILVDRFALAERGIAENRIAAGVRAADLGTVIAMLAEGRAAMWL